MKYIRVFEQHIMGTAPEVYVSLQDVLICGLESEFHSLLRKEKEFSAPRVYVSTKGLKHSYDRRKSFTENNIEFLFRTLKHPDYICKNVLGENGKMVQKRGDFIFFKQRSGNKYYAVPVEVVESGGGETLFVVSFFPSKLSYIQKFPTLWSGDNKKFPTLWDREDGEVPPS